MTSGLRSSTPVCPLRVPQELTWEPRALNKGREPCCPCEVSAKATKWLTSPSLSGETHPKGAPGAGFWSQRGEENPQ